MIEVELPDGTVVEFPEGTTQEAMMTALAGLGYGKPAPRQETPEETQIKALTDQAKAAYAAGNDEEGKRLLVEASRLSADSGMAPEGFTADPRTGGMVDLRSDPTIPEGGLTSFGVGAMQGLGYNFGDEVIGGMAAITGNDPRFATERAREMDRRAQESPVAYYGGMIPGAVATSLSAGKALGLGPMLTGTTGQRAIAGMGLGTLEGGLSGAGGGETTQERIQNMLTYGGFGAVVGGAAPYAIKGAGAAYDAATGVAASMRTAPSEIRASRALERALRASGMSADEIDQALAKAAAEGQPEYMVADALGTPGQRLLGSVYRTSEEAQAPIRDTLLNRTEGQARRLGSFVEDAFGFRPVQSGTTGTAIAGQVLDTPDDVLSRGTRSAARLTDALTTARGEAADAAYTAARGNAAPVDVRGAIAAIDDRIGGMSGSGIAGDGIDAKLAAYRGRLAGNGAGLGPDVTSAELSDFNRVLGVKQSIQDDIGAAIRAGRNNEARELSKVVAQLDAALESASDGYRAANDDFRAASRVIDAVDVGRGMPSSGRAVDNIDTFRALGPTEQRAARVGYGDNLLERIGNQSETRNKAAIFGPMDTKAEVDAIAINPALLNSRVARENTMFDTMNMAVGGSQTAMRQADDAALSPQTVGIIANLLRNPREAAIQAGMGAVNALQGRNTATRELIANMLMGRDIQRAVAPAIAAEAKAGPRRAVLEALVRGLPRPATN